MRRMSVDRNRKQSRQARDLARAAILLAIAALVQWIRLVLPLPPVVSLLLIGMVVNLCLCLSVWSSSLKLTAVSCLLLAYVQLKGLETVLLVAHNTFLSNRFWLVCGPK